MVSATHFAAPDVAPVRPLCGEWRGSSDCTPERSSVTCLDCLLLLGRPHIVRSTRDAARLARAPDRPDPAPSEQGAQPAEMIALPAAPAARPPGSPPQRPAPVARIRVVRR
jgi:hypothetical protein